MYDAATGRRWQSCHEVTLSLGRVGLHGFEAELSGTVLCGRTPMRHVAVGDIRAKHLRWAASSGLCDVRVAESLRFWELWSDCATEVEPEAASIIADYCLVYTVLDDAAESYFTAASTEVAAAALSDFVAILRGQVPTGGIAEDFPKYHPLVTALADLRGRVLGHARTDAWSMLVEGVDRYRRGVLQQIYMSRHGIPVSRETQIYNRQLNVAFDPTVVLLCLLTGTPMARDEDEPMMERLHIAVCRAGAVINDIISFPKETSEADALGQYHNLVAANLNEFCRIRGLGNPLELAIERTFEFHNNELRDVIAIGAHLVRTRPELGRYQQLGLDMHRSWMNWCLAADRYRAAFDEDDVVRGERPIRVVMPGVMGGVSEIAARRAPRALAANPPNNSA